MIKDDFCDFCNNIKLDNFEDMQTTVKGITKKLNKHYYDIDDDESNMYIVGSVGRTTAIKNTSDLDILFNLPKSVYDRINDNDGNKQSQLLQEVKNVLKEKYPNTDLKGDGQVVVINFTKYTVELVPGFKQNDDSFKYPDTNDGGSWKITNPIPEIDECKKKDDDTNGNFTNICHMLRSWKNKKGFKFKGLLIDTLTNNFLEKKKEYQNCGYENYLNLVKDIFEFLKNEDKDQSYWFAIGSNQKIYNDDGGKFVKKAKKAYNKIKDLNEDSKNLNKELRNLFGKEFPKAQNEEEEKEQYTYDHTEEFIEDEYPVDVVLNLKLDCIVTQDGFRPASLRDMITNHVLLKRDKKLEFYIVNKAEIMNYGIDKILWKVKNEGDLAKQKNDIRGQILETNSYTHTEYSKFDGDHYVEAYIIKNDVCIAKGKIDVPIRV